MIKPFDDSASPPGLWTPHEDLNRLLQHWLVGLHRLLGGNLAAVYLQGSLAVGDFDAASDVDFLVVLHEDIPAAGVGVIHRLHQDLCRLPNPWARSFEGSYAPAFAIRRLCTTPRDPPGQARPDGVREPGMWRSGPFAYPFWFVSEDEPAVRREYDNCQLVRWVVREKGLCLAGPPGQALIDPVSGDELKREAAQILAGNLERLSPELAWFHSTYGQASGVLTCARALEMAATGEVRSKRSAVAFAQAHLEPRWARLVSAAFAERARSAAQPHPVRRPQARAVADTIAFWQWAARNTAAG
jgi:Domain of unknown function (DUF4111)